TSSVALPVTLISRCAETLVVASPPTWSRELASTATVSSPPTASSRLAPTDWVKSWPVLRSLSFPTTMAMSCWPITGTPPEPAPPGGVLVQLAVNVPGKLQLHPAVRVRVDLLAGGASDAGGVQTGDARPGSGAGRPEGLRSGHSLEVEVALPRPRFDQGGGL